MCLLSIGELEETKEAEDQASEEGRVSVEEAENQAIEEGSQKVKQAQRKAKIKRVKKETKGQGVLGIYNREQGKFHNERTGRNRVCRRSNSIEKEKG